MECVKKEKKSASTNEILSSWQNISHLNYKVVTRHIRNECPPWVYWKGHFSPHWLSLCTAHLLPTASLLRRRLVLWLPLVAVHSWKSSARWAAPGPLAGHSTGWSGTPRQDPAETAWRLVKWWPAAKDPGCGPTLCRWLLPRRNKVFGWRPLQSTQGLALYWMHSLH